MGSICSCCQKNNVTQLTPMTTSSMGESSKMLLEEKPLPKLMAKPSKLGQEVLVEIDKELIVGNQKGSPYAKYTIQKKLGEGSYGVVYKAVHKITNDLRAIKMISKPQSKNSSVDKKLNQEVINEIEVLKKIDHQNIMKIFEIYDSEKEYYLVTEFCEGGELFDIIQKAGHLEEEFAATLMYQIFSAVFYCHCINIIHRDLKPENILLEKEMKNGYSRIKIIDFGTAKIFEKNSIQRRVIGSRYYIAPEVLSKKYNEKCDLWSCGVILYIMLSGVPPFWGDTSEEIFEKIKIGEYEMFGKEWGKVSLHAKDLIRQLLVKDPAKRISAEEALNHEWFKKFNVKENLCYIKNDKILKLLSNVKKYKPDKVLQQAAIAYLVHNNPQLEEVQEACKMFVKIDKNNDGSIVKEEFVNGLKEYFTIQDGENFENELDEIFDIIDADCSGYIEYEEFVRAAICKEKFLDPVILDFAFKYFDKDSSGEITLDEIVEVFCQNKYNSNNTAKEDFKKIINEVDINGDGNIDFNEFRIMMEKILK